jgi:sterol desaturase/sphingolipid hydroxylase (fatty acid hydroxylase superfamily)
VVEAALAVGVVSDAFQHANIRMDMTRPLNRAWNTVLNNPHFHCWHHTRDGALRDGNYGNVLTIWDRIFGTEVTGDLPPERYGLPDKQQLQQTVLSLQLLRSA